MNENQPLVFCSTIEIDSAQSTKNVQKAIEDIGKDAKVKVNGIDFNFDEVAKQFNKMVSQSFQISDNKIIGVTQAFKNQFGEIITLQHRVNEENQATLTSAKTTSNILEVQKSKYEEIRRLYEELGKLQVESVYANKKRTEELANETKNLKRNITLKEKELQSDERFLNVELQKSTIDKQKIANAKSLGQAEKEIYDTQQKRLKLENEIFKVKMQSENLDGSLSKQDLTVVEKQLELLETERNKLNGKLGYHGWNTKEYKEELEQITSINKLKEKAMTSDSKRVQLNNTLLATQKEINQLELQTQKNKGKDASLEATLNAQLLEKRAQYAKTETEINKQGLQCEKTKTAILKENEKHQKSIAQEIAKQTTQQEKLNKSLEQNQKKLQQRIDNLKNTNTDFITSDNLVALDKLEQKIKNLSATSTSHLAEQMRDLNLEFGKISSDVHSNKLKKTNSALGELGTTMKNVATYVSSAMVIDRLWDELAKGVEHIKDVDSAFTNMSMTMESLTKTQFNNMLSEVNAMSQQMGAVASETLQIAQTFANDKVTTEEVMAKLQPSVALMNISGMEATDVTKSIMSIANSYQMLADDGSNAAEVTEYLGDVLAKVSANMDMDFQDGLQGLVNGIGVAGSTMKAAGVDMEWFVAQLGNAMVATGQSADKLGRGMRTITARVMQQKQALEEMGESVEEVEIAMAKGEKTLNEIGVSIRDDLSGDLKSFSSIMDELGARWDGLTDSTKYYLAEQLAGKNQMDIFIGMMDSYRNSMELTEIAYKAQGTLMDMNGKHAESLKGKLNTLTSAKQQLQQTFINTDAYKSTIDVFTTIVQTMTKVIDKVGALPTVMAPLSMAFLSFNNLGKMTSQTLMDLVAKKSKWVDNTIKVRNEKQLLVETTKLGIAKLKDDIVTQESLGKCTADLVGQLKTKNATLKQTQLELVGATIKTTALQVAMSALVSLGISAITWALSQAVGWLIQYADYAGRAQEATNQVNASAKDIENRLTGKNSESIQQMEELVSKYNDINTSEADKLKLAEEINTVKNTLIGLDEEYEGILNNQELSYEQQLNLLKAINQEKMRDSAEDLDKALDDKEGVSGTSAHHADQLEKVKKNILEIQELMSKMSDGQTVEFNGFTRSKEELETILEDQKEKFQNHYLFLSDWNGNVQALMDAGYDTEKIKYSLEEYEGLFNTVTEEMAIKAEETGTLLEQIEGKAKQYASTMNESLGGDFDVKSASQSLKSLVIKMEDLKDGSEDAEKALEVLHDVFKDMPDDVDDVGDAIDYLNGKLKETEDASEMKGLNETYLEAVEGIEEASSLLDSLSDGLTASEMRAIFDSTYMNDYNGSLTDTVAIQEHLNGKIQEMSDAANAAYTQMNRDSEEFWNNQMTKTDEWRAYEEQTQAQLTDFFASQLGIQSEDFSTYINDKGGMRDIDLTNAHTLGEAEVMLNSGYLNQLLTWYAQYVNEKGGFRVTDMGNIEEFLNQQGGIEIRTINQLIEAWNNYYNKKKAEVSQAIRQLTQLGGQMYNELTELEKAGAQVYDKYDMGNYSAETNKIMSQMKELENANKMMQTFFEGGYASFDGVGGGLGQNRVTPNSLKGSGGSKGGGSGSSSRPSSSSSSKSPSSSSSSSSSSKATEKEVEDLDLQIDKFQELEEAINRVSEALERNSHAQQMVGTKAELKGLLTEEIALMEKKQKAIGELQAEIRKEQQALKEWGHRANLKFDGDELVGDLVTGGSIADRLQDAEDWANSASGAEKEWRKNDTLQVQENIERYYELMNKLGDVTSQYNEMTIAIRNAKKEQEKLLKEVENMADRYLKFAMKEKALDNELSLNRRKQEYAVGIELIQLRERELEILKQQRDVNSGKIDELKKEKNELADLIQKSGFTIGSDGTITNYDEIWKEKTDEYNKLAGLDAEDYKEKLDELEENIDRYLELVNDELPNAEEYYYDIADALKEIEEQQKAWAEQLEEVMDKLDRLYDVTKKLSKAENELALIEQKLNVAQGDDKIALLKRQEELYQAQKNLMQEQLNIQKQMRDEQQMELSNLGVEFDEDGFVSNYDDLVKKMQKQIESMPGGEARDKAIEELEKLIEKIEEYDSLVRDEIPSTEQTWWELTASIKEAQREQLQIVQDVQESIANAIKNKWQESTNALSEEIDKQKELLDKQWSDEDWEDSLGKAEMELNKLQAQINNLSKDTSLAGQLKLEQLKEQYKEQLDELNQMIKDHERENTNQMLEDEKNKLDEEMNNLLTPEKLAEMVNQALSTGMVQIGEETLTLNELMLDNIMQQEDAYYALGEVMKSEMLDSLEQAKKLYKDIASLTDSIVANTSGMSFNGSSINGSRALTQSVDYRAIQEELASAIKELNNVKVASQRQTSILENNNSPLVSVVIEGQTDGSVTLSDVQKVAQEQCDKLIIQLNELMR